MAGWNLDWLRREFRPGGYRWSGTVVFWILDRSKLRGDGSQDGLWVERLAFGSAPADLLVTGEIGFKPALDGRFQVRSVVDLESAAHWWDPNLVTGFEPAGRLELEGYVAMTEASGLVLRLGHRGQPIRIAGYDLEVLDLAFENGQPRVHLAHPDWGRATLTMTAPGLPISLPLSPRLRSTAYWRSPRRASLQWLGDRQSSPERLTARSLIRFCPSSSPAALSWR